MFGEFDGVQDKWKDWHTISQIHAMMVDIPEDSIGKDVAIDIPDEEEWVYGKVISIGEYKGGKHVRFQALKTITLEDEEGNQRTIMQEDIEKLLFKEGE